MSVNPTPLRNKDNSAILDAIRADGSMDYQNRIPTADKAGVQTVIKSLTKAPKPIFNEFVDTLVNRIGLVIARNNSWSNPLAQFKQGMLQFGSTIEEIQVGLLEAHGYDPDRDYMERTLFGAETPEVQTNFHTVNRQDFYKVSVNNALLSRAFLEEQGLANFATKLMEAPSTSDQWDEFLLTCSLFAQYESNGGYSHVHVPEVADIESNADDAKYALRKMRAMAENLQFLSTKYNAARMPVSAKPEDLVVFVTPEFNAAIDVEALSAAFHIERSEMYGKIVPIPADQFGIDGCQAIMTTKDFFVIADQTFENTSQWNPAALMNNYFLHHWQVISASRFVPAVMFTTGADDEVITVSDPVTGVSTITFEADAEGNPVTSVSRGNMVALIANATSADGNGDPSVSWSLTGNTSTGTFITQHGVLHIGYDETASTVTAKATSTWIDPTNTRNDSQTATLTVTIDGPVLTSWPAQGAIAGITVKGYAVPAFTPATTTYTLAIDSGATVKTADVEVWSNGPISSSVNVSKVTGGYTVTVTADPGAGAPVTYTVNVTNA